MWKDIATAPRDRELELRGKIAHSLEHQRNTGKATSEVTGRGRFLWEGHWSGILGGKPTHYRTPQPPETEA